MLIDTSKWRGRVNQCVLMYDWDSVWGGGTRVPTSEAIPTAWSGLQLEMCAPIQRERMCCIEDCEKTRCSQAPCCCLFLPPR